MLNWSASTSDLNQPQDERVVVNTASRAALLQAIESALAQAHGFTVATLNLDHVVKLRRDARFRHAYSRHSHVVADGNPIVWLARLSGTPVELVPGSELVEPVAAIAARTLAPVAFLGGTDAALEVAAAQLEARHPGLRVVSRIAPPMGFDPEGAAADAAIDDIAASGARVCFVALGAPKQEIFAARAAESLPKVGFLSIGAGLDFIAGHQSRAPAWIRSIAAEWLWRLGSNPRRLARRYADCALIVPVLAYEALACRRSRT